MNSGTRVLENEKKTVRLRVKILRHIVIFNRFYISFERCVKSNNTRARMNFTRVIRKLGKSVRLKATPLIGTLIFFICSILCLGRGRKNPRYEHYPNVIIPLTRSGIKSVKQNVPLILRCKHFIIRV